MNTLKRKLPLTEFFFNKEDTRLLILKLRGRVHLTVLGKNPLRTPYSPPKPLNLTLTLTPASYGGEGGGGVPDTEFNGRYILSNFDNANVETQQLDTPDDLTSLLHSRQ